MACPELVGGESYVIKQSGLRIQRDHTLDIERVLIANAVKGRVLIWRARNLCRENHKPLASACGEVSSFELLRLSSIFF
jgi:hypothetical protein